MKKRILFDIISLQGFHNGGEAFVRAILKKLTESAECELLGLYDSTLHFLDNDKVEFSQKYKLFDVKENRIADIVQQERIDLFFIGIAQRYMSYDLNDINCKIICSVLDIGDLEIYHNDLYFHFKPTLKRFIGVFLNYFYKESKYSLAKKNKMEYSDFFRVMARNKTELVTISEYSRDCMKYFFPQLSHKKIDVVYPPCISGGREVAFEDEQIEKIISESRFILMLNVNRANKNDGIVRRVFKRLELDWESVYLVTTGNKELSIEGKVVNLSFVSSGNLEYLYKKAWCLIYPSFTEGFGYPPLEAMKYGTPTVCANVCSMTEVLENDVVWFSPFYEEDLYSKLLYLKENYEEYSEKSKERSGYVKEKQGKDFNKLIANLLK